eukprot:TRINITY_DN8839_c0_g1_i2.p1 TRINITY_DN8839_c0_g1~~TRINITY_DN8839_c0_g1_i2.p1  ORF type:complete len:123 (+),score=12.11 TRINITY_DN8839_c0_g1_i2:98-466(+)
MISFFIANGLKVILSLILIFFKSSVLRKALDKDKSDFGLMVARRRNFSNAICDGILNILMILYGWIAIENLSQVDSRSRIIFMVTSMNLFLFDLGLLELILVVISMNLDLPGWFIWMNGFHN